MIKQQIVDSALVIEPSDLRHGTSVDLEINEQSGHVSRLRQYRVYLPSGYTEQQRYPLIMVLHGCRQTHLDIQAISGFDAIADRVGAIVVYPFITSYSGVRTSNCWGWWLTRQRQRGRGEVNDLFRIAENVITSYAVDDRRVHICGLSAGAAMSVACLASYSDFWTSGASIAGVPYGESERSVRVNRHVPVRRKLVSTLVRMLSRELVSDAPPLLVVQSNADKMVGPKLGANLRDTWTAVSDCHKEPSQLYSDITHGIGWRLEQYCKQGRTRVAHFLIDELEHGWPGGLPGEYSFPEAPNISELIWSFFDNCT